MRLGNISFLCLASSLLTCENEMLIYKKLDFQRLQRSHKIHFIYI